MEFLSEGITLISINLLIFLIVPLSPVELSLQMSLNTIHPALVNPHLQISQKILQLWPRVVLQILGMKL